MKNFANPEMEIVKLSVADVITASGGEVCDTHNPACTLEGERD